VINGLRVLAVCPARGGSKGIALKNIRPIAGIPMVARVGHVVARVPEIDRAIMIGRNHRIATIAEQAALAAPFRRPIGAFR
jgi:CMP-N,N'-diacetyllegionaminic acid synthase